MFFEPPMWVPIFSDSQYGRNDNPVDTLFLSPPSCDGFNGSIGSCYRPRRELTNRPTCPRLSNDSCFLLDLARKDGSVDVQFIWDTLKCMKLLEQELKTFEENRGSLLANSEGKFVLIHDGSVIAVYDSKVDALAEGFKRFGNVPFLVKQVLKLDLPQNFVSNLIAV